MIKIGLTGGIGSGKTTVANFFIDLGIPVYFADDEAKKLMNSSKKIKKELINQFGDLAFENGELDRTYLASVVFNDSAKLDVLNSIVHPKVAKHFKSWVKKQDAPYIIKEAAILFENKSTSNFDFIITVTAPVTVRIERVIKRDNTSEDKIVAVMNNQLEDAQKMKLSDFVIDNIDLSSTENQVKKLHKKLLKIAAKEGKS